MPCDASDILTPLQVKAMETLDREVLGTTLVESLTDAMPRAVWVGIYWLRGSTLELGPYHGAATDHRRIEAGQGVCGNAVRSDDDQVVGDVRLVDNYLACSTAVRSEIVVLIRSRGDVIGVLDLDAEAVDAFDTDDHCVLRAVADSFGGLLAARTGQPASAAEEGDPDATEA